MDDDRFFSRALKRGAAQQQQVGAEHDGADPEHPKGVVGRRVGRILARPLDQDGGKDEREQTVDEPDGSERTEGGRPDRATRHDGCLSDLDHQPECRAGCGAFQRVGADYSG